MLARTKEEILHHIDEIKEADPLGFGRSVLLYYLPYDDVKSYLEEGVTEEEWKALDQLDPVDAIKDYMDFAWEKALNERGISAYRSLAKIEQWAWLSGDEELTSLVDSRCYHDYGKDQLASVCRYLEIENWEEIAKPYYLRED